MRGIGLLWWILLARRQARLAHVGPQLLDAPQLHADPALAFGKIRCALAVLGAWPERHAVGLAQDADDVVPGAALLALVGDALGDRLDGVDVGVVEPRQQPGGGGLGLGLGSRASGSRGFHDDFGRRHFHWRYSRTSPVRSMLTLNSRPH